MIENLRDDIVSRGLLDDPQVSDGIIFGRAHVDAAGAHVWFNVDPELEEDAAPDATALLRGIERMLTISTEQWQSVIAEIVGEIEDAVGDEPVDETTDLRDDLALNSVVIFAEATLLRFEAPRQFPDSWIQVQLDDDLALEDLAVEPKDEDDAVEFDSLDDLLDHLSES